MIMFNERNQMYIMEHIHTLILLKKLIVDGLNKGNNFMNVSRIMYFDLDCKRWYYFERLDTLSIIFGDIMYFGMKQQYVWQKHCVKIKTRKNKMQEMRKDNENNRKHKNSRNEASYFNQCVLKYHCINTILNGFNICLSKVERYKSGDINMIAKYTKNIFKINLNDDTQNVDVILNRIIIRNTDNVVEFRFDTNMLHIFWLLLSLLSLILLLMPKIGVNDSTMPKVTNDNCFERELKHVVQPAQAVEATTTIRIYDDTYATNFSALEAETAVGSRCEIVGDYLLLLVKYVEIKALICMCKIVFICFFVELFCLLFF